MIVSSRPSRWPFLFALLISATLGCSSGGGAGPKKPGKPPPPAPELTSVLPPSGPVSGGTRITVETLGFQDDFSVRIPAVRVGGQPAVQVSAVDAAAVTALTPAGPAPGAVDVEIVAQTGDSAVLPGGFLYVPLPPPPDCSITAVAPPSGSEVGGTAVEILGADFEIDPSTAVHFGGNPASGVVVQGATRITCTVPPYAGGGPVDVEVRGPSTSCILPGGFTYDPLPTCTIVPPLAPGNGSSAGGTFVAISGSGFEAGSTVTFDGLPATQVNSLGGTLLTLYSPAAANPLGGYTVDVEIRTPLGATCSLPAAYSYDLAVVDCTPSGISPSSGPQRGGTTVTITGSDFKPLPAGADPAVTIGGMAAAVTLADDTSILCVTPVVPTPGPADVRIVNHTGGVCDIPGGFDYVPSGGGPCEFDPATPIAPASGDVVGGTSVTIRGRYFDPGGTTVFFGSEPATGVNVSAAGNEITCVSPAGLSPGFVDVVVVPQIGDACTLALGFEYTGCSFTVFPLWGPVHGTNPVTIDGTGFEVGASRVFFDGVESPMYWVREAGQIVCDAPPSPCGVACFVDLTVSHPAAGTQCTSTNGYEYRGCQITDIQPRTGPMMGGTSVTITGTDFDPGGAEVFFGNHLADDVVVDPTGTQITCVTPPSLVDAPVPVEIKSIGLVNICPSPVEFTYETPAAPVACRIDSVFPDSGPIDGGTPVTIQGADFDTNGAAVLFCCRAATNVVVVSDTEIRCSSPRATDAMGGGLVDVSVVNANGGICTRTNAYLYYTPANCFPCTAFGMAPDPATSPLDAAGETQPRTITGQNFCDIAVVRFVQQDPSGTQHMALGDVISRTGDAIEVVAPPAPLGPGTVVIVVDNAGAGLCGSIVGTYQ